VLHSTTHEVRVARRVLDERSTSAKRLPSFLGKVYDALPPRQSCRNRSHPFGSAAATLVQLAGVLHHEIRAITRADMRSVFMRRQLLISLEPRSPYTRPRRVEIIDAFLLLVPPTTQRWHKFSTTASSLHQPVASLSTSVVTRFSICWRVVANAQVPSCVCRSRRTQTENSESLSRSLVAVVASRRQNMKRLTT